MAACIHAEDLVVDHMCDPCERVPIGLVKSGEGPGDSRHRNATIHHWVFHDISTVIESDELVPYHLRIDSKRDRRQAQQDEQIGPPPRCGIPLRHGASSVCCSKVTCFSPLRRPFGHSVCGTIRSPTADYLWKAVHRNRARLSSPLLLRLCFDDAKLSDVRKQRPPAKFLIAALSLQRELLRWNG